MESRTVQRQLDHLRSKIKSANEVTQGATAIVAWAVFWPELIYHSAAVAPKDKAEVARLTGEYKAITSAYAIKGCDASGTEAPIGVSPPASSASSAN